MRIFERLRSRDFRARSSRGPRDIAPFALAFLAFMFALWLAVLGAMILAAVR